MKERKKVAILTKSYKNKGYCVAGIDAETGEWIRLVSDDEESHGSLFREHMSYEDGGECQVLDIVSVPVLGPDPGQYQPENVMIDTEGWWKKKGTISLDEVLELHPLEEHDCLLGNKYHYITDAKIGTVGHSLILVKVSMLVITRPEDRGPRASFRYRFDTYENMAVTDPDIYSVEDGTKYDSAVLVMSLPEVPYNDRYFNKFIAKIFL